MLTSSPADALPSVAVGVNLFRELRGIRSAAGSSKCVPLPTHPGSTSATFHLHIRRTDRDQLLLITEVNKGPATAASSVLIVQNDFVNSADFDVVRVFDAANNPVSAEHEWSTLRFVRASYHSR